MSVRLTPSSQAPQPPAPSPYAPPNGAPWLGEQAAPLPPEGVNWARYFDALKRHGIFIALFVAAGTALGYRAARRVRPIFETQATVWINSPRSAQAASPGAQQLLGQTSWVELLRSFAVVDAVVSRLNLNIYYQLPGDSLAFRSFTSGPKLRPGAYVLTVDATGQHYSLATAKGAVLELGVPGDSIGRELGFGWAPDKLLLPPGKVFEFGVTTPRNASLGILGQLRAQLPDDGQFLKITLTGTNPQRSASTVNALAEEFVTSATALKKRHLLEFKHMLGDQVGLAEHELNGSEVMLEQFRAKTITLPSGGSPTALTPTRDPVFTSYFQQKTNLEDVRADRAAVERMIAEAKGGPINTQQFLLLPSILNNTPQLRAAIDELSSRQASLRTEQRFLTDANPRVKQLSEAIHALEYETIPRITNSILQSLKRREGEISTTIGAQERNLREIPSRSIEEMRLVRRVSASETMYNTLKARYEEISLAEAQTTPDLSILDYAVAPVHPTSSSGQRVLFLFVMASIGFACALSLLHDRFDRLFRYPQDATHELGLTIAGTVPQFKPNRGGDFQLVTMSQAIESFRTLHLAVRYDFSDGGPVMLSVSSPGAGDGKSLVSSNLALAFASAGHRTLLIDGDIRCGTQHTTFGVPQSPGLVDYLNGTIGVDNLAQPTATPNLFLLPCGTRRKRAPELLVSDRMNALLLAAQQQFDVVIIDSPPFIAGVDAYALAAAAGSMLVVLRPGVSDRKLAAAKLEILDRLPIRILGAVLNGVPAGGAYRYYATDYYYGDTRANEPLGNLATPKGLVLRA
jgi:capsular exopolysaccharide synthesis family protein